MDLQSSSRHTIGTGRTIRRRQPGTLLFLLAVALLLTLPAILQLAGYRQKPLGENRIMAAIPQSPETWAGVLAWPRQVDAWLADHFGLRDHMVTANANIRFHLFGTLTSRQLTRGKDGFVFLNSHDASNPLSALYLLCGVPPTSRIAEHNAPLLAELLTRIKERHNNSTFLLVPSRPVLYPEKLPQWLQDHCAPHEPPIPAMLETVRRTTPAADQLVYPLDLFRARKETRPLYPRTHFHWVGETPHWMAGWIAENRFKRQPLRDLPVTPVKVGSDLAHFMPGINLLADGLLPDYAGAGIDACVGGACYPELNGLGERLLDVTRYRASEPGPRLLILSDSFGHYIAGYFAAYYGEVRHVATNHMAQLSPEERRKVMQVMFKDYAPDDVLYLFHDGSIVLLPMLQSWLFD